MLGREFQLLSPFLATEHRRLYNAKKSGPCDPNQAPAMVSPVFLPAQKPKPSPASSGSCYRARVWLAGCQCTMAQAWSQESATVVVTSPPSLYQCQSQCHHSHSLLWSVVMTVGLRKEKRIQMHYDVKSNMISNRTKPTNHQNRTEH